jgi:hypothetical protein
LETLLNILTTHGGSFQKFEFEFRSGISSNNCEQDFRKIAFTVDDATAVRPSPRGSTRQQPALSAIEPALEQAGPRQMDGGKGASTASLSPDQYAREETVAEVTSMP